MISFFTNDIEVPGLDVELFSLWLMSVCKEEGKECGSIDVVFQSDEELLEMNKSYLNHDYYTDIITFDYCEDNVVNGELYISIDRVSENAKTFSVDLLQELKRVCVHGVLHLCGYGDKLEDDILLMREKESFYMLNYVSRET